MKKVLFVLLICLLFIPGCNKKDEPKKEENKVVEEIDYNVSSIEDIISYKILNNYKHVDNYTLSDFNDDLELANGNNIIVQENYESKDDDGYFSVELFSYKNRDIVGFSEISEDGYIEILVNKTNLKIDEHDFYIGFSSHDDEEKSIVRAYVRHNDYVIRFSESNFDVPVTNKQYNEFIEMIKTVKFK